MGEIMVILVVALLFIGPEKLPGAAKSIGKGIRQLRKHTQDLQNTVEQDETIGGAVRELKSVLRGIDDPRPAIEPKPASGTAARTPPAPAPSALPAAIPETKPDPDPSSSNG